MRRAWGIGLGLVLVLGCVWPAGPVAAQGRVSSLGQYVGYSSPVYTEWVRNSQYVTARDGTRLAVDILRPARDGQPVSERLPVIWAQHRYHRADMPGGKLTTVLDQSPWLLMVLKHGYVVAAADVRGSGASFGTRRSELPPEEALDAYDITEWFAAQPWCDGNVGMYGRSYLGVTQLMAAGAKPPHLKAIFPEMSPIDPYLLMYSGGVFRNDFAVGWGGMLKRLDRGGAVAPVDEDQDGNLLRQALAQHQGNVDILLVASALKFRDSTYSSTGSQLYLEAGPSNHWQEIQRSGVPVYQLAGWFDPFVREDLLALANLDNPQRIVIGPWSHTDTRGLDLAAEHLRWYDYWLKGIDNGILQEPRITYYTMGAAPGQEWRTTATWPPPEAQPSRFYLLAGRSGSAASKNDGLLGVQSASEATGRDEYTVDYTTTSGNATRWTNAYGGPFGYRDMTPNDAKGLTYSSAPLTENVEVTGHPLLHLWVTCTAPDADVFAYLEEVEADGKSSYVTEGVLRASLRATATAPYETLGLPYRRFFRADAADLPAEPTELVFDLLPTSNVFDAGNRIRLTITGADKDNALTPQVSPAPVLSVYREAAHASFLELPVMQAVAPTPQPTATPLPVPTSTPAPSPQPTAASAKPAGPAAGPPLGVWVAAAVALLVIALLAFVWLRRRS